MQQGIFFVRGYSEELPAWLNHKGYRYKARAVRSIP